MNSNPLLIQLLQFFTVVYAVVKPALIAYVLLAFFLVNEKNTGSVQQQTKGVMYFILQSVSFVLLSVGAIPPIIAVISGQQMQAEWYITFLFTFSSGGLLFLWIDNKIRMLPAAAYSFTKMLYLGCIQIIGIICIAFTLISIALATLYNQIQSPGWWAIPVGTIAYGFLLGWLTADKKPKFAFTSPMQTTSVATTTVRKTTTTPAKKGKIAPKKKAVTTVTTKKTATKRGTSSVKKKRT